MRNVWAAAALMTLAAVGGGSAQDRETKVRKDIQKFSADEYWIYNDLPKAVARAKSEGKPIVAILRCIP